MHIKTILAATATAFLLATTSLSAQSDPVVDAIVKDLVAMGYMHIEIKKTGSSIKVEARGDTGKIERVYDKDGNIVKEEVTAPTPDQSDGSGGTGGVGGVEDDSNDDGDNGIDDDSDDDGNGGNDDNGDDDEADGDSDDDNGNDGTDDDGNDDNDDDNDD